MSEPKDVAATPAGIPRPEAIATRFTTPTYEHLKQLEDELLLLGYRQGHIMGVHAELVRVTREKPFIIYHEPTWRMLLGERDMVLIDLSSWAEAFHHSKAGFLRKLREPDLVALSRQWDNKDDPWRDEAFQRLFPDATSGVPSTCDIDLLTARLENEFRPLLDDRNKHRAHRYENRKAATAGMMAPAAVRSYLLKCQSLVSDLRRLSSYSTFNSYGYDAKANPDDEHVQDMVDLVLCGSIFWIVNYGICVTPSPEPGHYWQRRNAYYEACHAAHAARGLPDHPFNDRSQVELRLAIEGKDGSP